MSTARGRPRVRFGGDEHPCLHHELRDPDGAQEGRLSAAIGTGDDQECLPITGHVVPDAASVDLRLSAGSYSPRAASSASRWAPGRESRRAHPWRQALHAGSGSRRRRPAPSAASGRTGGCARRTRRALPTRDEPLSCISASVRIRHRRVRGPVGVGAAPWPTGRQCRPSRWRRPQHETGPASSGPRRALRRIPRRRSAVRHAGGWTGGTVVELASRSRTTSGTPRTRSGRHAPRSSLADAGTTPGRHREQRPTGRRSSREADPETPDAARWSPSSPPSVGKAPGAPPRCPTVPRIACR